MTTHDTSLHLTSRELDVLMLVRDGLTTKDIAQKLVISQTTVNSYTRNICNKLGVSRRYEAVRKAVLLGLLEPI